MGSKRRRDQSIAASFTVQGPLAKREPLLGSPRTTLLDDDLDATMTVAPAIRYLRCVPAPHPCHDAIAGDAAVFEVMRHGIRATLGNARVRRIRAGLVGVPINDDLSGRMGA